MVAASSGENNMAGTNASIKALRGLLSTIAVAPEEIAKHAQELFGRNDRLIAIVVGSAVEASLQGLLVARMPKGSGDLFAFKGALSTFSAKVAVAYAFGLIDSDVRRNADYIRDMGVPRRALAQRVGC
jgi:hypothetical protein